VLETNINKDGRVEIASVITRHPLLNQAAIDAVKQWVYRPVLLNGQPVDIVTTITVNIPNQN
jgi:protein TonB